MANFKQRRHEKIQGIGVARAAGSGGLFLKIRKRKKMGPPIKTSNFLLCDEMTLISSFNDSVAKALISLVSLSSHPYIEISPDKQHNCEILF